MSESLPPRKDECLCVNEETCCKMHYLFVDESGTPAKPGQQEPGFFTFGGIIIPEDQWHRVRAKFLGLKRRMQYRGEVKWRYFSPQNSDEANPLLIDAGEACAAFHDETVRNVDSRRVQCDEIWSFIYAKDKNVKKAKAAPRKAGDVWTWTALDADNKMILSYQIGDRSGMTAIELMDDLRPRLANRVQLTTDGHKAYLEALEGAFGGDVDYAMLIKLYGESADVQKRYSPGECIGIKKLPIEGRPKKEDISTSYVERSNLSMRMGMRRFTRLTNAFSKKLENHAHMCALYFLHYNFVRIHKTLKVTPAMEAGITDTLHDGTSW